MKKEHDRKVGLVVKSIQYSTYKKTIAHIPTVYQLVTARQNSQSKDDRKVGLVVKSVQYSIYTKNIARIPTVYQLVTTRQNSQSKKPTYFEERT